MDTQKLLIADASVGFCGALTETLCGAYELRVCHDGLKARELLDSFHPDVLLIDLALPELDGIAVLKDLNACARRPITLVTTRYRSPYIESAIGALGVDYLMMKPCDIRTLADRIHDLAGCAGEIAAPLPSPQRTVTNMLLAVNLSTKWKGFQFLEEAVVLYARDPGQSVTKVLYPEVAKRFKTSALSVERSIRSAIHSAWRQRDERTWRLYFTPGRDGTMPRPTNTTFMASLAHQLQRQMEEAL